MDDNPFNLMPLTMILETKLNIGVEKALNGAQAIEAYVQNRNQSQECNCGKAFRLILMDINMQIMEGYQATENIFKFMSDN